MTDTDDRLQGERAKKVVPAHLLIIVATAFVLDRLSKWWAANYLVERGAIKINDFITLRATTNQGIAFGMFQGIGRLVGWLSILIVIGLFLYMLHTPRSMWLARIGMAMIIGGALGNLIDRVTAGEVLDFIIIPVRTGIFNMADVMVNSGMVLLIAGVLFHKGTPDEVMGQELTGGRDAGD